MKTDFPLPEKESIESILIRRLLESREVHQFISQAVKQMYVQMKTEQKLMYEDVAAEWQLCLATVKRLTPGQLELMGFEKVKGGAWVRFRRIAYVKPSKELFRAIKKGQNLH